MNNNLDWTLITTSSCARCKAVKAALDKNGITYKVIDAEDQPEVAMKYGLMSVPAMVVKSNSIERVFKGEKEIMDFIASKGF